MECGVTTMALESTEDYWQNLYTELIGFGFEVVPANGKFTKNAKGKKTDVKDCRWIQKLHALDLLTSSSLPHLATEQFRTYCRQRGNWIQLASSASNKMQKFLKLLNFRLNVVVKDVCGLTGMKILQGKPKGYPPLELLKKNRLQKGKAFNRKCNGKKTGRDNLEYDHKKNVLRRSKAICVP